MVHGTCCSHHAVASCIVQSPQTGQSVFSKGFPKHFLPETVISNNGYPSYARPHGATSVVYVVCKKKKLSCLRTRTLLDCTDWNLRLPTIPDLLPNEIHLGFSPGGTMLKHVVLFPGLYVLIPLRSCVCFLLFCIVWTVRCIDWIVIVSLCRSCADNVSGKLDLPLHGAHRTIGAGGWLTEIRSS